MVVCGGAGLVGVGGQSGVLDGSSHEERGHRWSSHAVSWHAGCSHAGGSHVGSRHGRSRLSSSEGGSTTRIHQYVLQTRERQCVWSGDLRWIGQDLKHLVDTWLGSVEVVKEVQTFLVQEGHRNKIFLRQKLRTERVSPAVQVWRRALVVVVV